MSFPLCSNVMSTTVLCPHFFRVDSPVPKLLGLSAVHGFQGIPHWKSPQMQGNVSSKVMFLLWCSLQVVY